MEESRIKNNGGKDWVEDTCSEDIFYRCDPPSTLEEVWAVIEKAFYKVSVKTLGEIQNLNGHTERIKNVLERRP